MAKTSNEALNSMAQKLKKDPSVRNWEAFRKALLGSNAKYYRTRYAKGKIHSLEDLAKSYCELFDGSYKVIATIPVYKKTSGPIEGALWYIRGMLNANMPLDPHAAERGAVK